MCESIAPPAPAGERNGVQEAGGNAARFAEGNGQPSEVLTVDELAAFLRVERKTAYAAIARGEIPGVRRIGARLRVSRSAVVGWLAQGQGRVSRSRRRNP